MLGVEELFPVYEIGMCIKYHDEARVRELGEKLIDCLNSVLKDGDYMVADVVTTLYALLGAYVNQELRNIE